jgi:hypothetical protein
MSRSIFQFSQTALELNALILGLVLQLAGFAVYRWLLRRGQPSRTKLLWLGSCFFLGSLLCLLSGLSSRDIVLLVAQAWLAAFWFRLVRFEFGRGR